MEDKPILKSRTNVGIIIGAVCAIGALVAAALKAEGPIQWIPLILKIFETIGLSIAGIGGRALGGSIVTALRSNGGAAK